MRYIGSADHYIVIMDIIELLFVMPLSLIPISICEHIMMLTFFHLVDQCIYIPMVINMLKVLLALRHQKHDFFLS